MSRHRAVRAMLDDYYSEEEHDYDSEDYQEEEEEDDYSEEQARVDEGALAHVARQVSTSKGTLPQQAQTLRGIQLKSLAFSAPTTTTTTTAAAALNSSALKSTTLKSGSLSLKSLSGSNMATVSTGSSQPTLSLKSLLYSTSSAVPSTPSIKLITKQPSSSPPLIPTTSTTYSPIQPSLFASILFNEDSSDADSPVLSEPTLSDLFTHHSHHPFIDKPTPSSTISTQPKKPVVRPPSGPARVIRIGASSTASGIKVKHENDELTASMEDMAINKAKTGSTSQHQQQPPPSTAISSKKAKLDLKREYAARQSSTKPSLNLIVAGHVDAGKSTLMGHLLYLLGHVDSKLMRRYERDSNQIGKGSFSYAWVLDETKEERERGVTIDVAVSSFETSARQFVLLDAPGHRDFIPNMISGAAHADAALLVVDAAPGQFESGFQPNGQTQEHALLLRSLGVSELVVVVNKMDIAGWQRARFDAIRDQVGSFLVQQAGFRSSDVSFVACSGLVGQNLIEPYTASEAEWYTTHSSYSLATDADSKQIGSARGPTLAEALDKLRIPQRDIEKPLRFSISTLTTSTAPGSSSAMTVSGRVDQGGVQVHERVLVMPANVQATIRHISSEASLSTGASTSTRSGNQQEKWAVCGDFIRITLSGLEDTQIGPGSVLCSLQNPIPVGRRVQAQIVVFRDVAVPLIKGSRVLFHRQSLSEQATVSELLYLVDSSHASPVVGVKKRPPRALTKGVTAAIELTMEDPRGICIEPFRESRDFGRFMLRMNGRTVAAGIVERLIS